MKATFYPIVFTVEKDTVVWINRNSIAYRWSESEYLATQMASHYNAVKMEVKLNYWDTLTWMDIKCIPCNFKGCWRIVDITRIQENRIKLFLASIQYKAENEYAECSQDTHSSEFKEWLKDRATFYNNGFYEYGLTHSIKQKDVKIVSDVINGRYEELYICSEHKSERYSGVYSEQNSNFTIAKYNGKIVVFGTGTDECGSDWLDFCIFHIYDKLEDVVALNRATVHAKKANGTDVTKLHEFCALYNKTL